MIPQMFQSIFPILRSQYRISEENKSVLFSFPDLDTTPRFKDLGEDGELSPLTGRYFRYGL